MFALNDSWVTRLSPQAALGLRVKELRIRAGLTQENLAETTGLFRTYLSRIETGEANPTFTVLVALSSSLGVLPGTLFESPSSAAPLKVRSTALSSRGRVKR